MNNRTDELTQQDVFEDVRSVLVQTLGLPNRPDVAQASTQLIGSLPEFDSLAVVELIVGLERRFGIVIDDDDLTSETFATVGTLAALVGRKLVSGSAA